MRRRGEEAVPGDPSGGGGPRTATPSAAAAAPASDAAPTPSLCVVCSAPATAQCRRCGTLYCGPEHQAADWAEHKAGCKALGASRAAGAAKATTDAADHARACDNPACGVAACGAGVIACGGCATLCYCGVACLTAHWGEHKAACTEAVRARVRSNAGELQHAAPVLEGRLAGLRASAGDDHPETLLAISELGGLLMHQGRYKDAEPLTRECLEHYRRVLGLEHLNKSRGICL